MCVNYYNLFSAMTNNKISEKFQEFSYLRPYCPNFVAMPHEAEFPLSKDRYSRIQQHPTG